MPENTLVSPQTLAEHADDPGWVVFDCCFSLHSPDDGRNQYHNGHIPGAHYADLDRDLAGPRQDHTGRHPLPDTAVFIACHNILAMEISGWTGTRLYVGSRSERITDPRRAVETSVQQSS